MRTVKFEIGELLGIGMTIVVLGIGLAYGLQVMGDVKLDMAQDACSGMSMSYNSTSTNCYNSTNVSQTELAPGTAEYNATADTITGVAKIPEKLPTIVTVIVASVIIGILVTYLWARFS